MIILLVINFESQIIVLLFFLIVYIVYFSKFLAEVLCSDEAIAQQALQYLVVVPHEAREFAERDLLVGIEISSVEDLCSLPFNLGHRWCWPLGHRSQCSQTIGHQQSQLMPRDTLVFINIIEIKDQLGLLRQRPMTQKGQTSCKHILADKTISVLIKMVKDDISFPGTALKQPTDILFAQGRFIGEPLFELVNVSWLEVRHAGKCLVASYCLLVFG